VRPKRSSRARRQRRRAASRPICLARARPPATASSAPHNGTKALSDVRTRAPSRGPSRAGDPGARRSSGARPPARWPAARRRSPVRHRVGAARRTRAAARACARTAGSTPPRPQQPRAVAHPHLALARVPPRRQRPHAVRARHPASRERGLQPTLANSRHHQTTLLDARARASHTPTNRAGRRVLRATITPQKAA
jgi:hypothetical protein